MSERADLLILHESDDVATALRDLPPGPARLRGGASLTLRGPVPLGHKVALRGMRPGHHVRKYGAVIGEATAPIAAGEHTHVHNIRSLRARKREE